MEVNNRRRSIILVRRGAKPLLVALHTWSYDFDQDMSIPYAEWCVAHDWILIAPSFRWAEQPDGGDRLGAGGARCAGCRGLR